MNPPGYYVRKVRLNEQLTDDEVAEVREIVDVLHVKPLAEFLEQLDAERVEDNE